MLALHVDGLLMILVVLVVVGSLTHFNHSLYFVLLPILLIFYLFTFIIFNLWLFRLNWNILLNLNINIYKHFKPWYVTYIWLDFWTIKGVGELAVNFWAWRDQTQHWGTFIFASLRTIWDQDHPFNHYKISWHASRTLLSKGHAHEMEWKINYFIQKYLKGI